MKTKTKTKRLKKREKIFKHFKTSSKNSNRKYKKTNYNVKFLTIITLTCSHETGSN